MLNFYHYPPEKKGRLGKENTLSAFDFANTILKSRCIIKVSGSENCRNYSMECVDLLLRRSNKKKMRGFLVHEPSGSDIH